MEENGSHWGDIDVAPPTVDNKGRMNPDAMSDRELLIELVRGLRNAQDAVEDKLLPMVEQASSNPMLKMFLPK